MDTKAKPDAGQDTRSIVASRVYDAPRELVFDVWADPEHISEWWGPYGFSTTTSAFDLRPGGEWRFVMHGPDGTDYGNKVVYEEVVRPERLVYNHSGTDGAFDRVQFRVTVTFEEVGHGTRLTLRMVFPSAETYAFVSERGAIEGAEQTLARLADVLAARHGGAAKS